MSDLPRSDDPSISEEDKKTPEQRKAERLAEFRGISDPTMDNYWQDGEIPFGLPREEVVAKISNRRFEAIETAEIEFDAAFYHDVQEIVAAINRESGQNYSFGIYPVLVLEYQISLARNEEPKIAFDKVKYMTEQLGLYFQQAMGMTLQEWALGYAQAHEELKSDPEGDKKFFDILEHDYDTHIMNMGNLLRALAGYAREHDSQQIDINTAISVLNAQGFVVPPEWKEEFSEIFDGKEILTAIGKLPEKIHQLEIADEMIETLRDLNPEDLVSMVIDSGAVLKVIAQNHPVAETWGQCDGKTKELVTGVMEGIKDQLGGQISKKKGDPTIKI